MSRWGGRHRHDDTETALANFALTFAKALLVFSVILFVMISDKSKNNDGIKPKVEAVVMIDWPKNVNTDIDLWMRNPYNQIVYYGNQQAGGLFLDRDDLGNDCATVCSEMASIRRLDEGDYEVNLNVFYQEGIDTDQPLKYPVLVHVRIIQMNPTVNVLWQKDITLHYSKEEKHVVSFSIQNGILTNFDEDTPVMLMQKVGK